MKIGITGHSGFIGGSVSRALADAGYGIIPLDALTRSFQNEEKDFQDCPKDLDWILHFGAKTSIPDSIKSPFETYWNNVGSTITALKIADRCRSAFLFMSSYVYGQPQYVPIDEMHPVKPMNPYMGSKIISEDICRQLSSMVNMPLVILRGFNIFGDHHMPGRLIPDLLEAIRKKVPLVLNDPRPVRDYLYIKDFVSLVVKILTRDPIKTGTYNVGYGQELFESGSCRAGMSIIGTEMSLECPFESPSERRTGLFRGYKFNRSEPFPGSRNIRWKGH
jgi:nucleoside-diphosphate-sugar epimerase